MNDINETIETGTTVEIVARVIQLGLELGKSMEDIVQNVLERLCPKIDRIEKLEKTITAIRRDFECPYSNFRIANARLFEKDGCVLSCDHSQEKRDACWDRYTDEIENER